MAGKYSTFMKWSKNFETKLLIDMSHDRTKQQLPKELLNLIRQAVKVRSAPKTAFLASPLLIRQGMPAPKPIKKLKT